MAIAQPLTSFSNAVDDATVEGIDRDAPRIREIHQLLDRCAEESGPQRYESAVRAATKSNDGKFYLLGSRPSTALAALLETADEARVQFSNKLALSPDLMPPEGDIHIIQANVVASDPRAPMGTLLRMLEHDETTTPSSLESLFEDLEKAHRDGLIDLDAGGLSLTDKGRAMIRQASIALEPLSETTIDRIDMHAQEVADGRLSLQEAIVALGKDVNIDLPLPGQPDETGVGISLPDAGVRIDTALFDPLLQSLSQAATRDRAAVATVALHRRLEGWGLSSVEAQSVLRYDIRCLRALGASLSHGPIDIDQAQKVVFDENLDPIADIAADAITDTLLESLSGPMREHPEPEVEVLDIPKVGLLRRFLSVFLGFPRRKP